jgi:hypothetical protein
MQPMAVFDSSRYLDAAEAILCAADGPFGFGMGFALPWQSRY